MCCLVSKNTFFSHQKAYINFSKNNSTIGETLMISNSAFQIYFGYLIYLENGVGLTFKSSLKNFNIVMI